MSFATLTDKRALVTGGSRGIGRAIAEQLKAAGAEVLISGSNPETLAKVAEELGVGFVAADLNQPDAITKLAEEVGAVDILVNNAGITRDALFSKQSEEQWAEVLRVNLDSAVALTRALLPNMTKNRWGRIVNISSIVAHMGNIGQTNYITAKAAITGFTKGLSKEVARRGVTVNCVAPGFIETSMTDKIPEKIRDEFVGQIPAKRFGSPQEIAAAVRYLASEEAAYTTGTTIHVNGGLYV